MLLYARISITPFILVELGIVAWYFLYWDLFPKYSIKRLVPWLIFVASLIVIPLLQIGIYRKITSVKAIEDIFVFIVIFFESLFSVALIFYMLLERRSQKRNPR